MRILPFVLAAGLSAVTALAAQAAELQDFFGEWTGSGMSGEGAGATQNRDTSVTIERAADGFKITWSTMRTQLDDQSSSVVKSTTLKFKGTAEPKVYHGIDSGDPLKGGQTAWASVKGSTLKIHIFALDTDGSWNVQTYDRTLTSPTAMDVSFVRVTNGEVARKAQLKLTKSP